ncbi:hypothetical protein WA026_008497 [Henosepilachna vigintioctopunctata]|uniref:Uncharacterized protein n=1 Tax=Henosepilachna vigintioctopunctata TaxID=420089 RepID=A0AAW1UFP7_9CUCU
MVVKTVSVLLLLTGLSLVKGDIPKTVLKGLQKCFDKGGINGVVNCAGLRTLNIVNNLSSKDSLELVPGVILQRENEHAFMKPHFEEKDLPKIQRIFLRKFLNS